MKKLSGLNWLSLGAMALSLVSSIISSVADSKKNERLIATEVAKQLKLNAGKTE